MGREDRGTKERRGGEEWGISERGRRKVDREANKEE